MKLVRQKFYIAFSLVLTSLYNHAQQRPALSETNFLYSNETVWMKLYGIKTPFRKLQDKVTEYQSPNAVNAPDGKEIYTISVTSDANTITEISDKYKPNYKLRNVYTYGKNKKIKSKEIFDDNLDGKGWQFNEKFLYHYEVDKTGNYFNEVMTSTDPRPGADPPTPRKVKAYYNSKKRLVKYIEADYTYEYNYNDKGDITLEKTHGNAKDSEGETEYKYVYDAKGNWIKRETFRTNAFKDHLLEEVVNRKIEY